MGGVASKTGAREVRREVGQVNGTLIVARWRRRWAGLGTPLLPDNGFERASVSKAHHAVDQEYDSACACAAWRVCERNGAAFNRLVRESLNTQMRAYN